MKTWIRKTFLCHKNQNSTDMMLRVVGVVGL